MHLPVSPSKTSVRQLSGTRDGRPPDSRRESNVAEWKFERGGWLQVYENAERAGHGSLTLAVSSLDEQMADLKRCGLEAGGQMIGAKVRVIMIKDQDGNSIAFAETVEQSGDR